MNEEIACIFHPRLKALETYRVQDTISKQWFVYGLCPICSRRLKKEESFKAEISARLEELEHRLMKQEQKKGRDKCKQNPQ